MNHIITTWINKTIYPRHKSSPKENLYLGVLNGPQIFTESYTCSLQQSVQNSPTDYG